MKILTTTIAILLCFNVFSQTKENLKSEQIDIQGEFNPVIMDAFKISKSPVIVDSTRKLPNIKYSLLDKKWNTSFETTPIAAA